MALKNQVHKTWHRTLCAYRNLRECLQGVENNEGEIFSIIRNPTEDYTVVYYTTDKPKIVDGFTQNV